MSETFGFHHVSTGGGCTALVRRFGALRYDDERDAGAIVLTADDEDPQAPTDLDAPCIVGLYNPCELFDGGGPFAYRTVPTLREALGWGREQTSIHEAQARLPAHWE